MSEKYKLNRIKETADMFNKMHVSDLAIALKTVSEALMAKVVSNLSKRVLSALKEEIDSLQKIKVSEVEKAQNAILQLAKKLENEGKVILNDEFI